MTGLFCSSALEEAAVRFRELQAEKELRQLQEDRKNDKKPPPYKHIKVGGDNNMCLDPLSYTLATR